MGPQDKHEDSKRSNEESLQHGEHNDSGHSGEGARSALEEMLRKRQMRVNPPPTQVPPASQPQSEQQDKE